MRFSLFVFLAIIFMTSGCSVLRQKYVEPYGFKYDIYSVKPGEDIAYVAGQFGIPANTVLVLNNRQQYSEIEPNTQIKVPFYNEVFPVKISDDDWLKECYQLINGYPKLLWPVIGAKISSKYGQRWGSFHKGDDLRAPQGIPIFAAHSGRVIKSDAAMSGFGNLIVIEGRGLRTYYAHQSRFYVQYGDAVRQGDLIGYVGATGRVTGAHLHFETHIFNGEKYSLINPICFFRR